MVRLQPSGKLTVAISGLGTAQGLTYPSGVTQIFGIPYGRLPKRWTRGTLATSWTNDFHDGTQLGPRPPIESAIDESSIPFLPVPETFLAPAPVDELNSLNLNIVLPPASAGPGPFPVLLWLHGGAFTIGGNHLPVYDGANLASWAAERGTPTVFIHPNYRIGHGGFLASSDIKADLERDGHSGAGNFGFTDQMLALEWVQTYITKFRGDKDNVTVIGESAGSIAIALHLVSAHRPVFHRAICMSGQPSTAPAWTVSEQERRYTNLIKHFKIDPTQPGALDKLRAIPEADVADALNIGEEQAFRLSFPTLDNYLLSSPDRLSLDYSKTIPSTLSGLMLGHVRDEGSVFAGVGEHYTYTDYETALQLFLSPSETEQILALYDISPTSEPKTLQAAFHRLAGDMLFNIPNIFAARYSPLPRTYAYSFNEVSHLSHETKGLAYHGIDFLYLFLNLMESMSAEQIELARSFSGKVLDFAHGIEPWTPVGQDKDGEGQWMAFGADGREGVVAEGDQKASGETGGRLRELLLGDTGFAKRLQKAVRGLVYEFEVMERAFA
ncbi:Alpha/Beta hydrolase protein [Aspergillus karnatakaensis]|uniref:Alpha/Beta hydrolase protein n=1 Tax=Aspergillus karnatakaensis TaxID=1810916 RepID=UPI003CCDE4D5